VKNRGIPVAAVAAAAVVACAGAVWGDHVARTGSVTLGVKAVPDTAEQCGTLVDRLPTALEGRRSRKVVGGADRRAAAWGSPTTILKCGVKEPGVITVGGPDYDPLHNQLINIDGVNWLVQDQKPDSVTFTTTDRSAYVEVYVPGDTTHATDVLVDLGPLIIQSVPAKDGSGLVPDKS
jgi:hypothetical protein